jgi:multidrug efflux pump subunit AcrA (membrane-fusion protein)
VYFNHFLFAGWLHAMMRNSSEKGDRSFNRSHPSLARKHSLPHDQPFPVLLRIGLSARCILFSCFGFWSFQKRQIQPGKMPAAAESAGGLSTGEVKIQKIPALFEAVGTVQAEKLTTIASRVVASIMEIKVSAGQRVKTGESLVVLDDRDLRHRLEQAQDAVRGAEATLAQAQADYKRDKPLFDQQVIAPTTLTHQTNLKTRGQSCQIEQEQRG